MGLAIDKIRMVFVMVNGYYVIVKLYVCMCFINIVICRVDMCYRSNNNDYYSLWAGHSLRA